MAKSEIESYEKTYFDHLRCVMQHGSRFNLQIARHSMFFKFFSSELQGVPNTGTQQNLAQQCNSEL